MGEFANRNAQNVLKNVEACIAELEAINGKSYSDIKDKINYHRHKRIKYDWRHDNRTYAFKIDDVFEELSIFDWWNETLSVSQLKQMQSFLKTAIKLGFNGYVCFKVGAIGCSHGMWAHKDESTNGYSPDGDCIFHSFRSGDCYWDAEINGKWLRDWGIADKNGDIEHGYEYTLGQIKKAMSVA